MDSARLHLEACKFIGCKGPAMDLSDQAHVTVVDCSLRDNVGEALAT